MANSALNHHSSWLQVAGNNAEDLAATLEARVQERIAAGDYSVENVKYIEEIKLELSSGTLDVSDEMLERLRHLCQLWDVRLTPTEITSHRKILGPVIVFFKRLIYPVIQFLLKDFVKQQRFFNAAVIQAVADMANQSPAETRPVKK